MARVDTVGLDDWVARLEQLSKMLEDEFGYKMEKTGGSIGVNSADVTFHITPVETTKYDPLDAAPARAFKRAARVIGLEPDDLGRAFMHNNLTYTVIGYEPVRDKFILVLDAKGEIRAGGSELLSSIRASRTPA
jgi:hypothetical protein